MDRVFCDKLSALPTCQSSTVSAERHCRHARTATLLALVAVHSATLAADDKWGLCGGGLVLPERPAVDIEREPGEPADTVTVAEELGRAGLLASVGGGSAELREAPGGGVDAVVTLRSP